MFSAFGIFMVAMLSLVVAELNATDTTQTSLWLSSAAYCAKESYLSRTYKGPSTGFVGTYVIYDSKSDTTGYIGYMPSEKKIYVVFRGSSSTKNWISDLDALKETYSSYPECNCQVHKGFYDAEQRVISNVIAEVKRLQSSLSGYSVTVTGHSLGAALSHLAVMDITKAGITANVINFGMPRVGTPQYSAFAASKVTSTKRYVHNKDQVPHLPFEEKMTFKHVCTEFFENSSGSVKQCDASCEDPSCGDQFAFSQTNWDDHGIYLGLVMGCNSVSK